MCIRDRTYPLSHRRYVTAGVVEERGHDVCVSITNGARPQRVLFDFTECNLLTFLQERITDGLRSSDVRLVLFQDKDRGDEDDRIKSVYVKRGCVHFKDKKNGSIVLNVNKWSCFVWLIPIIKKHVARLYCEQETIKLYIDHVVSRVRKDGTCARRTRFAIT